jgi:hypothetical protein
VPAPTVQRALSIVAAWRGAGPLTTVSTVATPGTTPGTTPPRTEIDARDGRGEVVVTVLDESPQLAAVVGWDGGTTSYQWTFDPSAAASAVAGPTSLPTTVSRMTIAAGTAPSTATTPVGTPGAGSGAGSATNAGTGIHPDGSIGWCLVAAVQPAIQGSGYGPLITFSGAVGFCTASPVLITDTLILWQQIGGGYNQVGSSYGGGTNSDTDGSVVPCYSPWSTYYAYHDQMIVSLSYNGQPGYGYVNSPSGSLNCSS